MAGNLIQIKRSLTNAISSSTPTLAPGELAFTQLSNTFWIGAPDGTQNIRIGGAMYPGTLTPNSSLVANSTSGIDKIIVANSVVGKIYANSSFGDTNYILYSGGAGDNVYWDVAPSTNTALDYAWTGQHDWYANSTFYANTWIRTDAAYNTIGEGQSALWIGNSTVNTYLTSNYYSGTAENAKHLDTYTASQLSVNNSVYLNGKTEPNLNVNSAIRITNSTVAYTINDLITYNNIAAAVLPLDANAAFYVKNTTHQATLGDIYQMSASAYTNAMADTLTRNSLFTGNSVWNTGTIQTFNGKAVFNTNSVFVGQADFSGNVSIEDFVLSDLIAYGNSTVVPGSLGNTSYGWNGLHLANSSGIEIKATIEVPAGESINYFDVTTVKIGQNSPAGFQGAVGFEDYGAIFPKNFKTGLNNDGSLISMYDAIRIPKLVAPILLTDKFSVNTISSTTGQVTINSNTVFNSNSVILNNGYIQAPEGRFTSIQISGEIIQAGTAYTACSEVIEIHSAFIELAPDNDHGDVLDSGFITKWQVSDGEGGWLDNYSGIYRKHGSSTSNPVWKIYGTDVSGFGGIEDGTPNADDKYTGTLEAFLQPWGAGGAFVANAQAINITANSTVSVAITANTLTLQSALGVSSGGTGLSSYTVGSVLYASGTGTIGEILSGTGGAKEGQVLQIVNNLPAYGTLDGGTF